MKISILLSILALLAACTSTQKILESGNLKIGKSKEEVSDLFLLTMKDDPFLCECGDYYEDLEIEILPNKSRNIFLVFEDVTRPLKDFVDDKGNGRLLNYYTTYEEAYAVIEKYRIVEQQKKIAAKEIDGQKREQERILREERYERLLAENNRKKEKELAAKKIAAQKREQERILRLKENNKKLEKYKAQRLSNNDNEKIINAIKFVLSGDKANWHSPDNPISKQNYSFGNCVYSTWDENSGKLSQWDFNKIKWKTRDSSVEQNWVFTNVYHTYYNYRCDGTCRTSGDISYSKMSFEATGDGFRTLDALGDIKRKCRGVVTPY